MLIPFLIDGGMIRCIPLRQERRICSPGFSTPGGGKTGGEYPGGRIPWNAEKPVGEYPGGRIPRAPGCGKTGGRKPWWTETPGRGKTVADQEGTNKHRTSIEQATNKPAS